MNREGRAISHIHFRLRSHRFGRSLLQPVDISSGLNRSRRGRNRVRLRGWACGLEFLTDFDGSFWLPFESGRRNPPYVFYGNDDGVGKVVLVEVNRSVYTNFMGVEIPLRRVRGPVVTVPCA